MNNKYFRHISLWAAAVLLLCLCGCGKNGSEVELELEQTGTPDIFIEEAEQLPRDSTPPNLVIETISGEVATATYATLGGYVWEWIDENGSIKLSEEESPCAADMKSIVTIDRSSTDGKARLQITGGTLRSVYMWVDGAPMEEREKLTVENDTIIFPDSGAYRYEIVVEYTGGRVYYAFMITE